MQGVQSRRTRAQLAKKVISSKLSSNPGMHFSLVRLTFSGSGFLAVFFLTLLFLALAGVRFDGTNFYSTFPITCVNEEWMFEIHDKEYQVRLVKCDALKANEFDEEIIQVFNVVLNSAMNEVLTRIGRDYYDTKAPFSFPDRFQQYDRIAPQQLYNFLMNIFLADCMNPSRFTPVMPHRSLPSASETRFP